MSEWLDKNSYVDLWSKKKKRRLIQKQNCRDKCRANDFSNQKPKLQVNICGKVDKYFFLNSEKKIIDIYFWVKVTIYYNQL